MDVRKIIGLNIKRLRVAQKITQEQLANDAKIDRAYVGRIEMGKENVTIARLEDLAAILKVPVAKFFDDLKDEAIPEALPPGRKPKN